MLKIKCYSYIVYQYKKANRFIVSTLYVELDQRQANRYFNEILKKSVTYANYQELQILNIWEFKKEPII